MEEDQPTMISPDMGEEKVEVKVEPSKEVAPAYVGKWITGEGGEKLFLEININKDNTTAVRLSDTEKRMVANLKSFEELIRLVKNLRKKVREISEL